ncbi:Glycosyltransferase involved in cell wall bisynthesis [Methylobacterium sp. 174MFSha1.1]|nr:Glycosyltransferase involved in cell wall bisynthesis [Methylobacterium sp. 174MFSha1.1]
MKIAQVVPYYSPVIGGVEAICQSISEELVRRGHEVHVLTANRDHKGATRRHMECQEIINGVHVFRFRSYASIGHHALFPGILSVLRAGNYDIIHCHGYRQPQSEISALVGQWLSTPTILHIHGGFYANTIGKKIYYGLFDQLARIKILSRFNHYITLSKVDKQRLLELNIKPRAISIIGNAADPSAFIKVDTSDFIKKYGLEGKSVILYLGIMRKHKRPDLLVEALSKIVKSVPEAFLLLVGPDEGEWAMMERLGHELGVSSHFRWIGPLQGPEKHAAIECAAFLALASDEDPYPIAVLEALAHGKPILTTHVIGQAEIITQSRAGLVVAPGDVEALADAALKLLRDDKLRAEISENARHLALKSFSIDSMINEMEDLYMQLEKFGFRSSMGAG